NLKMGFKRNSRGEDIYEPPETIDEILEREKLGYMEQDPLRDDELRDPHRMIKVELLGIIATYQEPVCCNRIFKDYFELNGFTLDPTKHGFKNFSSMMRTFTDKFNHHKDGERTLYTAKTTERSAHLQDLIRNQITPEQKRAREARRARSYSRPRRGGGTTYGAAFNYFAQKFVPVHDDDRTPEERAADNLASFGRSLAAAAARAAEREGETGLDWSGTRRSRAPAPDDEEEACTPDVDDRLSSRSKSVPPPRPAMFTLTKDANANEEDLAECTNPFRVQNNIRIRDIIVEHGESDDTGRKGLALCDLAKSFKNKYRQPLGGLPNLKIEVLHKRMSPVKTTEWEVEEMGGVVYVVVPAETVEWTQRVGPGTAVKPRAEWDEKPRLSASPQRESGEVLVVKTTVIAGEDGDPMVVDHPGPPLLEGAIDRATILSVRAYAKLPPELEKLAGRMTLLKWQEMPRSVSRSSSSASSICSRTSRLSGSSERSDPSKTTAEMWSTPAGQGYRPSSSAVPSFGTFKNSQPPTPAQPSLAASDDRDDSSEILQPSVSNLAGFLPQKSFGASQPTTTPSSSFPSSFGGAAAAPVSKNLLGGRPAPVFGTGSQAVSAARVNLPTFGTTSSSVPTSQSAFGAGGSRPSDNEKPAALSPTKPPVRKMVEVIEDESASMSDLLGETIQFIGKLRSGEKLFIQSIKGTPLEDVVAENHDFFDIDEVDDHIHLLHNDVDPRLLTVGGKQLGEVKKEEKKEEIKPLSERTTFSRPTPTFARPAEQENKMSFNRPIPTFGRPAEQENKPRETPVFGTSTRSMEKPMPIDETDSEPVVNSSVGSVARHIRDAPSFGTVNRPTPIVETPKVVEAPRPVSPVPEIAKPLAGMPSFGTRSGSVAPARTDNSNRSEMLRAAPTFGSRQEERPASVMSERIEENKGSSIASSRPASVMSNGVGESTISNAPSSIRSSVATLNQEDEETKKEAEERRRAEVSFMDAEREYPFPSHEGIRQLWKTSSFAFDASKKGEFHMAAILTSFHPNRLLLSYVDDKMKQIETLHDYMASLRPAYSDRLPLGDSVQLGQLAVAISTDVIVRVVVLKKIGKEYQCACLDINAIINATGADLFELDERFGVDKSPSITFVARLGGVRMLNAVCHKAIDFVAKNEENSEDMKRRQPVVFHGIDKDLDELCVDVLATVGGDYLWLGESLPTSFGAIRTDIRPSNPDVKTALAYAAKMDAEGYEVRKTEEEMRGMKIEEEKREESTTPTIDSVNFDNAMEKEEDRRRADSFSSTATSESTAIDMRAAGAVAADFVARPIKDESPEEFVVAAPPAVKPIINVESMESLISSLNDQEEYLEAESIKCMARALILMVNRRLASDGKRAAVIANSEALEEIESFN
ncbi:hypothetical protein PFISCL1PPCAC_505, partial [Pristionchus fissidentatus]